MYLENGKISERQCFRIGVLENIAVGIIVIPYITANVAGKWHMPALLLGLIFTCIYGGFVFFLSKAFPEGLIEYVSESMGIPGKFIQIFYVLRYAVKAGLIIIFFGGIIQEYLLRSYNMWWLIIPFVLICGYGGNKDIEKRGRLLEMVFWWMIVPIILIAVFSISNIDWKAVPSMFGFFMSEMSQGRGNIFLGAYMVVIVLSTLELMIFTLPKQKKNTWENGLKILVWIIIAIFLAHVFIIAILGRDWTGSHSAAVLSVMEASTFPGGTIERLDYPVLAFWIIGVFATVSGYMFYGKELINHLFSGDNYKERMWSMPVIIILYAVASYLWSIENVAKVLTWYIVWIDLALSVVIPLIIWLIKKGRVKTFLKGTIKEVNAKKSIFLLALIGISMNLTACRSVDKTVEMTQDMNTNYEPLDEKQLSLEDRDYVVSLNISEGRWGKTEYSFEFEIADLKEYKGSSEGTLKKVEYTCQGDSIKSALNEYYEATGRQLDLGHLSDIELDDDLKNEEVNAFITELSDMPYVAKSVIVEFTQGGVEKEMLLRDMIKEVYSGENSM